MAYRDEVEVDIEEILCRWSLQKNRNIALIFSEEYLNQLEQEEEEHDDAGVAEGKTSS